MSSDHLIILGIGIIALICVVVILALVLLNEVPDD